MTRFWRFENQKIASSATKKTYSSIDRRFSTFSVQFASVNSWESCSSSAYSVSKRRMFWIYLNKRYRAIIWVESKFEQNLLSRQITYIKFERVLIATYIKDSIVESYQYRISSLTCWSFLIEIKTLVSSNFIDELTRKHLFMSKRFNIFFKYVI